jgi:hypothetical protein
VSCLPLFAPYSKNPSFVRIGWRVTPPVGTIAGGTEVLTCPEVLMTLDSLPLDSTL